MLWFMVSLTHVLSCYCAYHGLRWSCRPAAEAAEGAPVNKKQNLQAAAGGQLVLIHSPCTQVLKYLVTGFMFQQRVIH